MLRLKPIICLNLPKNFVNLATMLFDLRNISFDQCGILYFLFRRFNTDCRVNLFINFSDTFLLSAPTEPPPPLYTFLSLQFSSLVWLQSPLTSDYYLHILKNITWASNFLNIFINNLKASQASFRRRKKSSEVHESCAQNS